MQKALDVVFRNQIYYIAYELYQHEGTLNISYFINHSYYSQSIGKEFYYSLRQRQRIRRGKH